MGWKETNIYRERKTERRQTEKDEREREREREKKERNIDRKRPREREGERGEKRRNRQIKKDVEGDRQTEWQAVREKVNGLFFPHLDAHTELLRALRAFCTW